jgi:glycine betaine/choline ABC-type transport system substrate-binding protein
MRHSELNTISHLDIRVKNCSYGHSVETLLTPRGVTAVSHKYSLTFARHATMVVAVPSTVLNPANH